MEGDYTLKGCIEAVIDNALSKVSTFFPAQIIQARPVGDKKDVYVCDVHSGFLKYNFDKDTTEKRKILNVPIILPNRTNTFIIRPPMDADSLKGAYCGLLVSNNFLADWKQEGGQVFPSDGRKFHYADAVAILGLYPDKIGWDTPPKQKTAEIKVKDGNFLEIGNSTVDVLKILADLIKILLTNASIIDGAAGLDPNPATTLSTAIGDNGDTLATMFTKIQQLLSPES